MVQTCYICKWRADREPRRSFHKFPFVEAEKQKWLDIIGKSNVSLGKRTSVCSIHFERSCFRYGLVNGRELLRQGSVPTLQLTRPPEVDPYEDQYTMHEVDIEIKIEPDTPEDWYTPGDAETEIEDVPNTDRVPAESIIKTETDTTSKNNGTYKSIAIEVPQASNVKSTSTMAKNKQNSVKFKKMDISNRKEFLKKQSLVRMLVERLRRDHVKLKNYIQTLEERQKTVKRKKAKIVI